jgi:hypothetical protein
MKKIYSILVFCLLISGYGCHSQKNDNEKQVLASVASQLLNTEVTSLIFLSKELVSLCVDTTNLSRFHTYLKNRNSHKRKTSDDENEHVLALHVLYSRIFSLQLNEPALQESRENLLNALSNYKNITFEVDANFMINQLDNSKRSMINGYDEGSTNESWMIFFSFNPILLKNTLLENGNIKSWERSDVRLCNTFRENSIPVLVRTRIKQNAISHMEHFAQDEEIQKLIEKFKKCDVSIDLYD